MSSVSDYLSALHNIVNSSVVSDHAGESVVCETAIGQAIGLMHNTRDAGGKIIFVGNGGSAAIASHMAIDYSKNGRMPAMSFNDGAALTCLGNDLGYENVFSEQIKLHAKEDDLVVAISSSGSSPNILRAVAAANNCGCTLLTLSGFSSENPLRLMGALNWYVDSREYGFVEISHLTICHMILDIEMGWKDGIDDGSL